MKKLILLFTLFTLFFTSNLSAQNPNCYVVVSPMDTTICPGDSVFIQGYSNILGAGQSFGFNASTLPVGWSSTGSTAFIAPCGPGPTGIPNSPYYWASTASAGTIPGITTGGFDVTCGGTINFYMIYAIQGGASPCEGPDQYNEGVSLQYSLNGGATWLDIIYYAPNGTILPANPGSTSPGASGITPFTSWTAFSVPIPTAALSTNTKFRWTQSSTSGSCCDNWGLENIVINATAAPCGTNTIMNWSNGLIDTTSFWFTPSTDSTLWAIVMDTNGTQQCMSDTISVNLFDGNFTFALPGAANVYCPSASTTVGVTSIVGASTPVSYLWSTGTTSSSAAISGVGTTPDNIWYYVDVTDYCGYVQSDSVLLNVNQTLSIDTILSNPQVNCATNGTATAIVSGNQGVLTYQWFNVNGGQVSPSSSTTNNASGWFYITATDNVCTVNDSIFIPQIFIPFTFTLQDTVTTNCPSGNVIANVSALQNAPGATFLWSNANMVPMPAPNNLTFYQLPGNGIAPSAQKFYVTISSCGNTVIDSVILNVTDINNINFSLPDSAIVFCPEATTPIQVTGLTGTQGVFNYVWSTGLTGPTAFSTTLVGSTQEQFQEYVTVSVTDACGFVRIDSVLLITNKLLNIDSMQTVSTTTCQPDGSVISFPFGITGTPQFQWEDSVNYITPGNGDSVQATSWNNIGAGWYYFTVIDALCFDTDSIYVEQINPPVASFTANQTDGCAGMTVIFTNTSQNTNYFEWDFGNGNTATDNAITSHDEQYFSSGTVTLIAYLDDTKTCSNTSTMNIDVVVCGCTDQNALNYDPNAVVQSGTCIYPIPVVEDPNVFTPNGDGENDLFFFKTIYTVELKLNITNRWGNVMYDEILDLTVPIGSQGWDGRTPNGNEAKGGTYFYKYTAIGINGDEVSGKGFVQLVRD
jgi:gliding motility-associated-like protein